MKLFNKSPNISIVTTKSQVIFFDDNNEEKTYYLESSSLNPTLLQILTRPHTCDFLEKKLGKSTFDFLVKNQLIRESVSFPTVPLITPTSLLIAITGHVDALEIVSMIINIKLKWDWKIEVIFSKSALRIINPEIFQYFNIKVWHNSLEQQHQTQPLEHLLSQVHFDFFIIAPASERFIDTFAKNKKKDLIIALSSHLTCLKLLSPSLSLSRWKKDQNQRSLEIIKSLDFLIIEPNIHFSKYKLSSFGTSALKANSIENILNKANHSLIKGK